MHSLEDFIERDFYLLIAKFIINALISFGLIYFLSKQKEQKKPLLFTFAAVNLLIFFICYVMSSVKLSLGVAFGLFAIFSILRYRTTTMRVRDMTYLFAFISIGLINAIPLSTLGIEELTFINLAILTGLILFQNIWKPVLISSFKCEYTFDNHPPLHQKEKTIQILRQQTGMPITDFEIVLYDITQKRAELKVYYLS